MLYYWIIINIFTFLLFGLDKHRAVHHKWRIKEATLFLFSILGGSAGALIAMYLFHHKTRKWYFKWGIPLILVIQLLLFILYKILI